jgi:hypothetical protein
MLTPMILTHRLIHATLNLTFAFFLCASTWNAPQLCASLSDIEFLFAFVQENQTKLLQKALDSKYIQE